MLFAPDIFLTFGSLASAGVALLAAGLKTWLSRGRSEKMTTITIERPDGSKVQLNSATTTPEEIQRIIAAFEAPPKSGQQDGPKQ